MAKETEVERLLVRLIGDATQYQKMLVTAKVQTKRTMKDIGQSMSRMGRSLMMRVTAPLAAMGAVSVYAFAQFNKAMTESTSIMQVTAEQTEKMRDLALELSTVGAQGPKELANAYFFLASAGKDAEQSMALLPKVMAFATAGAFDMSSATDLLTDAQSALGLASKDVIKDAENMERVSDVLVKANTLANASVRQFSISLTSKAGAALKSFNKDVEEGVAVLAAMADQGMKAELSGNALSRIIRLLGKSSIDNADAHKKLGFQVFDTSGKMRNFADIIENLEDVLGGMSDQQKVLTLDMLGFEARVQGVILPLLGTSDAIRRYEKELRNAAGTTEEVAAKQMKSFSNQMKMLKNQIVAAAISLGQVLAPVVLSIMGVVADAAKAFKDWDKTTKAIVVTIGLLVAAIGPALMIGGAMLSMVANIITAYNSMSAAAIAAVKANWLLQASVIGVKGALIGLAAFGLILIIKEIGEAVFGLDEFNAQLERTKNLSEKLTKAWTKQQQAFLQSLPRMPTTIGQRRSVAEKRTETRMGLEGSTLRRQELETRAIAVGRQSGRVGFEAMTREAKIALGGATNKTLGAELKTVIGQESNLKSFLGRLAEETIRIDADELREEKQKARQGEVQAQADEAAEAVRGLLAPKTIQQQVNEAIAQQETQSQVQAGVARHNRKKEMARGVVADPRNLPPALEFEKVFGISPQEGKEYAERRMELLERIANGVEADRFEELVLPK